MALTAEQKEANKAARKARDKAWRERCKLRKAAEDAGLAEIAASDAAKRHAAAVAALDGLMGKGDEIEEIDRRIAALRARREELIGQQDARRDEIRRDRDAAWKEKNEAERELDRRLDEQFPDLTGHARWSAASWKPLA